MEISSNYYLRWEFVSNTVKWTQLNIFSHFTLRQTLRVQSHTHLQQWQESHWLYWEQDQIPWRCYIYSPLFPKYSWDKRVGVVGVFVRVCVWGVVVLVLIFKLTEKMNLGFFYTSSDEDSLVHSTASKRYPRSHKRRPHQNQGRIYLQRHLKWILKSHF